MHASLTLCSTTHSLILLFAYIASKLIPYSFRENDDAATRRELYKQFCQEEDLPERFKDIDNFVNVEESYWTNARYVPTYRHPPQLTVFSVFRSGLLLSTCIMTPKNTITKAVVCYCHGYTDHASFSSRISYQRLCERGIAVVSIEYEGHGRSDGPFGLINDWDTMVDDVSCFFAEVTAQRFPEVPAFLMGESMGGAVAYDTYNRDPSVFRGVVFVCPMCKISDDMLPPQYVIDVLKWLIGPTGTTSLLGFLPIAPAKNNLSDLVHRIKEKGELSHRCPLNFSRNPRLATARELINVTQRISETVSEFEAPFLVLHGLADRVTDPNLSKTLFNESCSLDKDIRLYKGMWVRYFTFVFGCLFAHTSLKFQHGLTSGEPDENIDRVFGDVASWIADRL